MMSGMTKKKAPSKETREVPFFGKSIIGGSVTWGKMGKFLNFTKTP